MLRNGNSQPAAGSRSKSFYLSVPCSLYYGGKMAMGTRLHQICVRQAGALSQTPKNCNAKFWSCSKTFPNPVPSHLTALPRRPHVLGCADCYGEYQDEGSMTHAFWELLQEEPTRTQVVTTMNRMNPAKCYVWEQHGGKEQPL